MREQIAEMWRRVWLFIHDKDERPLTADEVRKYLREIQEAEGRAQRAAHLAEAHRGSKCPHGENCEACNACVNEADRIARRR